MNVVYKSTLLKLKHTQQQELVLLVLSREMLLVFLYLLDSNSLLNSKDMTSKIDLFNVLYKLHAQPNDVRWTWTAIPKHNLLCFTILV